MKIKSCAYTSFISKDKINEFKCTNDRINTFFHEEAEELEKCGSGNTVIFYEETTGEIIAFYTISVRSLNVKELRKYKNFERTFMKDFLNNFNIVEFPALEIMRFGVNKNYTRMRIGTTIIRIIYQRVIDLRVHYNLPVNVIFIESLNEVTEFYEKLGFEFIQCSDEEQFLEKYPMLININKIIDIVYPESK